jgi:hypothetical protein
MLNVNCGVLLPDAVLVNYEIVAVNIWDEVSIRILNLQPEGYKSSPRIEMDLGPLFSLFPFE